MAMNTSISRTATTADARHDRASARGWISLLLKLVRLNVNEDGRLATPPNFQVNLTPSQRGLSRNLFQGSHETLRQASAALTFKCGAVSRRSATYINSMNDRVSMRNRKALSVRFIHSPLYSPSNERQKDRRDDQPPIGKVSQPLK